MKIKFLRDMTLHYRDVKRFTVTVKRGTATVTVNITVPMIVIVGDPLTLAVL